MDITTLIPDQFIPAIKPDNDGSDPRRLTLLHKRGDNLVCLLSRGMEEVEYEKPIEDCYVLSMFGREKVTIVYEPQIHFEERKVDHRSYTVAVTNNTIRKTTKKIPFLKSPSFLSEIIANGDSLNGKIDDLLSSKNDYVHMICEEIAEKGLFKAFKSPRIKEFKKSSKEVESAIFDHASALFGDVIDEVPVRKHDVKASDRKFQLFFSDPRKLSTKIRAKAICYGLGVPVATLLPSNLPDVLELSLRKEYDKRYDRVSDEKEKESIAISEFIVCNPKLVSGVRRGYFDFKRRADLTAFSAQVAINAFALSQLSPWLSIPYTALTAASGLIRAKNAIQSGGIDFSGITASIIYKVSEAYLKDQSRLNRKSRKR